MVAAGLRETGALVRADLAVHDALVRWAVPAQADERFVIVLESEADLRRWKFPLADAIFAELIARLLDAEAAVVAVDKYRDTPVEPGSDRLAQLLRGSDRVFWVRKFAATPGDAVPAPAALDPRFTGCADVIDDADGNVRRALVYLDDGKDVCYGLAFQIARALGAKQGIGADFPGEGDRLRFGQATLSAIDRGDGAYVRADTAGFQVAVPALAGAGARRVVGLTDVLEGRVPNETFRGRAVLVGSGAESLRDFFNIPAVTAEGYEKVSGVALHAMTAAYLLRAAEGRATRLDLASRMTLLVLTALAALATAAVGCSRRSPVWTLLGGTGVLLGVVALAAALATKGFLCSSSAPLVAGALAWVGGVGRGAWLERRERDQLMNLFGRHVSREVAEDLWRRREEFFTHGAVRPRMIVATILFLDVRGFTTVSERLEPERLVGWLNRGLTLMIGAIMEHGGVVTRFAGDAVMAVFGTPVPRKDEEEIAKDASNAIEAALVIGPRLDDLNRRFAAEGLPPLRVRIGINTGTVTQCSVGAADRAEFTVLGDATNTASRLESYEMKDDGEAARILVGEETSRLVRDAFATRLVGEILLKGKEKPVSIRQVLSKATVEEET